jgi:hypothetical protein
MSNQSHMKEEQKYMKYVQILFRLTLWIHFKYGGIKVDINKSII